MKLDYYGRKIKNGDILKRAFETSIIVISKYDSIEKEWYYDDIYDEYTFKEDEIDMDEFIIIGNINNEKDKCIKEKYIKDRDDAFGDWKGI